MINDPTSHYCFSRSVTDELGTQTVEHSYITKESTPWSPIMLQFAAFLEGCGYVGVYQRVNDMIDSFENEQDDWK